mmetsp:Transcript_101379/g.312705  ORF Transcript_101379/g.312705 Transcript_101379/m.312705 type:complete len:465 (-) Transcript_101379:13-1407(-)
MFVIDAAVRKEALEWFIPTMYAAFGFYIQSVCLHWATYCYVHKYALDPVIPPAQNPYAVLDDPVADNFKRENINLHYIDLAAGLIPMLFVGLMALEVAKLSKSKSWDVYYSARKALQMRKNLLLLWTKVMLCAGFLFTTKGIIGAVTTVPDSSGWKVCTARLKPEGVKYMKEEHTFWSMLVLDFAWNFLWYHHPLRYCSDMMYSGHTFVVTLFALGLYEYIRIVRPVRSKSTSTTTSSKSVIAFFKKHAIVFNMVCLSAVALFAIGEQCIEVYAVLKSRFHYTSDILVALVMTFLFYTNGVIAISAKLWSQHGLTLLDDSFYHAPEDGDSKAWDEMLDAVEEGSKYYGDLADTVPEEWEKLSSRGDIFIPPCCVPCCCLSGREHIYSDANVKAIIDQFVIGDAGKDPKKKEENLKQRRKLAEYLKRSMNFDEGVSMHNIKSKMSQVLQFLRRTPTTVHEGYSRA